LSEGCGREEVVMYDTHIACADLDALDGTATGPLVRVLVLEVYDTPVHL